MKKSIAFFLAAGLLALAPTGIEALQGAAPHSTSAKAASAPAVDPLARAKAIYQIDCALCHGANGDGKSDLATSMELKLDDWTDPKSLADHSDTELFDMIRKGKDKMPPEDSSRAKDDEVKSLILYIRGFSKPQTAAAQK